MCQIIAFGDSITYGFWDRQGGWISRLRKWADEKNLEFNNFYYRVYNQGIDGNTTKDLLERINNELPSRVEPTTKTLIIFAIGINDSAFINKKKKNQVPIDIFKNNIDQLINYALRYTKNILFIGSTPVDEEKVDPIPWAPDMSYKNKYIEIYKDKIKTLCFKRKIKYLDIYDTWIKSDYKKWLEDGVHPNSKGHKKIFEKVRKFLLETNLVQI